MLIDICVGLHEGLSAGALVGSLREGRWPDTVFWQLALSLGASNEYYTRVKQWQRLKYFFIAASPGKALARLSTTSILMSVPQ